MKFSEEKLTKINYLTKQIQISLQKLKEFENTPDIHIINRTIIELDQLYSEFFQLEKEGYYTETQFNIYKELQLSSRELLTSFGKNHPWYIHSYNNLQNFYITEDLNIHQIKHMQIRLNTGGKSIDNCN